MKHEHARRHALPFAWPDPPLNVALVEPEIPPNTGNIARLCAATGTRLHLVGPLGFRLTDSQVRRAGLDYWDAVDLVRHDSLESFLATRTASRCFFFSTRARLAHGAIRYQAGDTLVFGSESRGLPDALLDRYPDQVTGIPIRTGQVRSLNLATAAAIALYEALRQLQG
jgi:tRNA (cytidine/uridine-2'-O-)-methyltransferase